jgi:hypothetical protein
VALTGAVTGVDSALAQGDLCGVFTVEEVGEAFGEPLLAEPMPDGCSWYSEDAEAGFVFVSAYWDNLPMAERQTSMPGGTTLTVAGRDAYHVPDYFTLYVQLDQGLLALSGSVAEGDSLAALQRLGELAVERGAQLPPPALPATPAPAPSLESSADLEAMFPDSIGGEPLTVQSMTGEQMSISGDDPETTRRIEELLAANGLAVSDIAVGFGSSENLGGSITAIRFPGADASTFMELLLPTMLSDSGGEQGSAQVAGKDVTTVTSPTSTSYVYPQGDVIWVVVASDPQLTRIFEALP